MMAGVAIPVAAAVAVAAFALLGPSRTDADPSAPPATQQPSDAASHEPPPATASGRPSVDQPVPPAAVARLRAAVQQLTNPMPGRPTALQARLIDYQVDSWQSSNDFTLFVSLELHFAPGSATAWNEGHNDRFVRFSRQSGSQIYQLEWATAPFS